MLLNVPASSLIPFLIMTVVFYGVFNLLFTRVLKRTQSFSDAAWMLFLSFNACAVLDFWASPRPEKAGELPLVPTGVTFMLLALMLPPVAGFIRYWFHPVEVTPEQCAEQMAFTEWLKGQDKPFWAFFYQNWHTRRPVVTFFWMIVPMNIFMHLKWDLIGFPWTLFTFAVSLGMLRIEYLDWRWTKLGRPGYTASASVSALA